ncbi:MAG: hypothetical protein H7145_01665 [Akkermansiaceae bacterium]|nr:hypothetical protein [Armatimonadota bacterium]
MAEVIDEPTINAADPPAPPLTQTERYTFVVKVADRPGTLEIIGATFAHRGVSLSATVGCDGSLDPDGRATITLHFCSTPRRKEVLRATLSRLNRVLSVREVPSGLVQAVALVRVAPDAGLPLTEAAVFPLPSPGREPVYRLIGTPEAVESAIRAWRTAGKLRSVSYGVLAAD